MLETIWESRWLPDIYGGVAQLGEHLPCKQGVMSSNLTISTSCLNDAAQKLRFFAHVQARYKIEYLNSLMKTSFQQEFKHPILHRTLKTAYWNKLNLKYSMKLSDCGQADGVLAHTDDWTLDDADETSKLVCEFWMKNCFICKRYKTSEAYRKIR